MAMNCVSGGKECDGCQNCVDDFIAVCPECGRECQELYIFNGVDVLGCEECISLKDAYDFLHP